MLSSAKIEEILQLEPFLLIAGFCVVAYIVYKVFFRGLTQDRHQLLTRLFRNLLGHFVTFAVLCGIYYLVGMVTDNEGEAAHIASKLEPYLGFVAIIWGAIVFVKAARVFAFEYLFFVSMRAGVPVLLVNILSLGLSIALASWIATAIFGIRLAPVLATSALISLILGLAIQDTLGNLFAGVALQFDKPYEIGDWVEIQNSGQKWVGQIQEITWRSTVLIGTMDDLITIPNRIIAQSQVSTWGAQGRPFWRGVSYRIPFGQPVEEVRATLLNSVSNIPGILKIPKPNVYLNEIGESWLNFRLVFCIENYGAQFRINDLVNTAVMDALSRKKIPVATPSMRVTMTEAG